jgi:hypothetical protein
MFRLGRKHDVSAPVVTLDLHTTSPGEPPSAIKRNHIKKTKRFGGINLYHRADKIFLRSRITETGGHKLAELY